MITASVQRWNRGKARYRMAGEPIRTSEYDVAEIDEAGAKSFVEEHHYSHSYPAARRRFGLFRSGELVGVAVFSHPCNDRVITSVFGCERATDGLELGRFVLLDSVPANGESWFLARCRERLRDFVGIVSFADDTPRIAADGTVAFAGHLGTIYQASNAAFLGRGTARTLYVLPDGRTFNARAVQKIRNGERGWRYAAAELERFGAEPIADLNPVIWLHTWLPQIIRRISHPGNLRYAWSFSRSVVLDGKPYPKVKGGVYGSN
jgi:hypothetical protein